MAELDTVKIRSGPQTFCDYFCITWLLRLACAAAIVGTSGQEASKLSSELLKLFFKDFMHAGSCGSAPMLHIHQEMRELYRYPAFFKWK